MFRQERQQWRPGFEPQQLWCSKLAEQATQRGDSSAASDALHKCLEAACACEDSGAQGAAHHQIGLLAQKEGDYEEALRCQQQFLELSSQGADREQQRFCFSIKITYFLDTLTQKIWFLDNEK